MIAIHSPHHTWPRLFEHLVKHIQIILSESHHSTHKILGLPPQTSKIWDAINSLFPFLQSSFSSTSSPSFPSSFIPCIFPSDALNVQDLVQMNDDTTVSNETMNSPYQHFTYTHTINVIHIPGSPRLHPQPLFHPPTEFQQLFQRTGMSTKVQNVPQTLDIFCTSINHQTTESYVTDEMKFKPS